MLEEVFGREPESGLVDPGHDLNAEDRIAAQLEEVLVDADAIHAQHFGPGSRQDLLGRRGGSCP